MKIIKKSAEVEALARTVKSTDGVYFIPALAGLGAPHWKPEARGLIGGLTRGSNLGHIARATLEAMAHQNSDIMEAMEKDFERKIRVVRVDGGAAENNLLMQLQADFLGRDVERPSVIETTALGAAFLAGLGVGLWKDKSELKKLWKVQKNFKPVLGENQRTELRKRWLHLIRCSVHLEESASPG